MAWKCKPLPVRYHIMIMIFLSTYINYTTRTNLSQSLTAMVEVVDAKGKVDPVCVQLEKERTSTEDPITTPSTEPSNETTKADKKDEKDFHWTQNTQGQVLAAYGYGYVPASLPAGYIAERFGPFWTLFISIGLSGIFNSVGCWIVLVDNAGVWLFLFTRFLIGICGGMVYPALQCLIGRWAPPQERGKFVAAMMGNTIGTAFTWFLVAQVTEKWGWGWGFHVISLQHIPYLMLLWFLVYDSPEQHKRIKDEELKYIKESQAGRVSKSKGKPPYKAMSKSLPFWILNILHFGNLWGLYVQMFSVPKFMAEYIGYDIKKSKLFTPLPNLIRFFAGIGYGALGDYLKAHKFNREIVLKVGVIFSHVIPGCLMGCIGFVGCSAPAAMSLLVLSCSINGAAVLTNLSNPTDLAPNYAGTIFGIMSCLGGVTTFIVPSVQGGMIENLGNKASTWTFYFLIGGVIYVCFGIIFMIFGSSKTQSWNEHEEQTSESETTART